MNARFSKRKCLTGARGFTLMELIVAMTVIAILAAIAIPSYSQYITRSKMRVAQTALMEAAVRQQSYLLDRRVYATTANLGYQIPGEIEKDYNPIEVGGTPEGSPPTFLLTIEPLSSSSGLQTFTLDHRGVKSSNWSN
jgi:type IV pilus assembly protein PilE